MMTIMDLIKELEELSALIGADTEVRVTVDGERPYEYGLGSIALFDPGDNKLDIEAGPPDDPVLYLVGRPCVGRLPLEVRRLVNL